MKENESRGVKDVESVRRQQQKKEQMESLERNQSRSDTGGGLRVSTVYGVKCKYFLKEIFIYFLSGKFHKVP